MEKEDINFYNIYYKHQFGEKHKVWQALWHYTSIDGLMGIIDKAKDKQGSLHFWFTQSDCLNDVSEGHHIVELYRHYCDQLYKEQIISDAFYSGIKDIVIPDEMVMIFPVPSEDPDESKCVIDYQPCKAFICSFSLKEDSLDMWRYYSKGAGGYGLKLIPLLFDDYFEYEHSEYSQDNIFSPIKSYKVIYDDNEKANILKEVIFDTYCAYQNSRETEDSNIDQSQKHIRNVLKILQFQFKHQCYASEEEFRFVIYRPYKKPDLLQNELPPIKYRKQNGIIVPYLDIEVEEGDPYLQEVWISPFIGSETAIETTSAFLAESGFKTKVKKSQLPVRKW